MAFLSLLKERDGNRALSEQLVLQPQLEGARHAQEKEGVPSPRGGKNLTAPSVKTKQKHPPKPLQTNKNNAVSNLSIPLPRFMCLYGNISFFGPYVGWGSSPLEGNPPTPPPPSSPLLPLGTAGPTRGEGRARKAGALVTPTDPAAKCSRGQGYGQG